jgi:hypothetical protein
MAMAASAGGIGGIANPVVPNAVPLRIRSVDIEVPTFAGLVSGLPLAYGFEVRLSRALPRLPIPDPWLSITPAANGFDSAAPAPSIACYNTPVGREHTDGSTVFRYVKLDPTVEITGAVTIHSPQQNVSAQPRTKSPVGSLFRAADRSNCEGLILRAAAGASDYMTLTAPLDSAVSRGALVPIQVEILCRSGGYTYLYRAIVIVEHESQALLTIYPSVDGTVVEILDVRACAALPLRRPGGIPIPPADIDLLRAAAGSIEEFDSSHSIWGTNAPRAFLRSMDSQRAIPGAVFTLSGPFGYKSVAESDSGAPSPMEALESGNLLFQRAVLRTDLFRRYLGGIVGAFNPLADPAISANGSARVGIHAFYRFPLVINPGEAFVIGHRSPDPRPSFTPHGGCFARWTITFTADDAVAPFTQPEVYRVG